MGKLTLWIALGIAAVFPFTPAADELAELRRELAQVRSELQAEREARATDAKRHAAELEALRRELAREQEARLDREREFWEHAQAIGRLKVELPDELVFEVERPEGVPTDDEQAPPAPPVDLERGRQIRNQLRSLLFADGVGSMDLLEAGAPGEGWTGPVVFRILDPWGRPIGSVYAERLRLEASRAGRTVTLVLEEGYETRGGVKTPFDAGAGPAFADVARAGGLRRVVLPDVDPLPWFEALPELFDESSIEMPADDGLWDGIAVRVVLNGFLREDAAGGWYKLHSVGGIQDGVLRDVHLQFFDRDERLERRLFADRMRLVPQEQGMQIVLEDGVQMRGSRKTPFLQGRFRIYLPRARPDEWTEAGLPGLVEDPPEELRQAIEPDVAGDG